MASQGLTPPTRHATSELEWRRRLVLFKEQRAISPLSRVRVDDQRTGTSRAASTDSPRAEFEALYQRHSREVWALAYARWMNADTALDITQEAFLRLWRQWESGEKILNPRTWLIRVARNLAEDHAKSAFRRNGTHPRKP